MSELSDDALLAGARAGDRAALEALLARHQARIYRFGLKLCRDPDAAQDVVQDTLLAVARTVREFRGASSVSTWLYTIARSFCIKHRRRSKFAPHPETSIDDVGADAAALVDPGRSPAEALASREVEQAVEEAIAALEPGAREVLVLRDIEGLTAPEVAEITGLTVQAVKSRLHRARLAVRAQVAPLVAPALDGLPAAPGTCPDVLTMFSQHLEDEISADVCATMERHLASCPRCRGTCDSLKRTLAVCRTSGPAVEVPAAVQDSVKIALRDFLGSPA